MRNSYAQTLLEAKNKGVQQGLYLMSKICLIALENQVNLWDLPVEDQFFKDVESDIQSIFKEVVISVPNGDEREMAERLDYYVNEIRERRGMDGRE